MLETYNAPSGPKVMAVGKDNPDATVSFSPSGLTRTTTLAAYHDGVERYVTSFEFTGQGEEVGSIVPLPGVPSKVERGGDWTLQRLVPSIRIDDLQSGGAGVRAQAIFPNGELVQDFLLVTRRHALHVLNAPSPAATASLAIGQTIAGELIKVTTIPTTIISVNGIA